MTGVPGVLELRAGEELTFQVTVVDPEGDPVSLRLLNPQPGMAFAPLEDRPSPLTVGIRWLVPSRLTHGPRLRFAAHDAVTPSAVVVQTVTTRVRGTVFDMVAEGDVTGDGVTDVVACAIGADVAGTDAGAIYVFAGGSGAASSPTAGLVIPGALPGDLLGASGLQLVDVTGDGVLDVVANSWRADAVGAPDAGAVFVWAGGATLTGTAPPTATLRAPSPKADDHLSVLGTLVGDVTGDGTVDLVVCARDADVQAANVGSIYVWHGGAALTGAPPPVARLLVPSAAPDDFLGQGDGGRTIQLADVTADGTLDVVAGTDRADVAGVTDAGAVYVWKGGPALVGSAVAPSSTLTVPGAAPVDMLTFSEGQGVVLGDVTGDEKLDLVVVTSRAAVGGAIGAGAIYVWAGGGALGATPPPAATLTVPGPHDFDALTQFGLFGLGVTLADVDGDGVLDVVTGGNGIDVGGVRNTGAAYVWSGGPGLAGAPPPSATLTIPATVADDELGAAGDQGILVADVTGDWQPDVVVGAEGATVAGVPGVGGIWVWRGGATLSGTPAPLVSLTVPGASPYSFLGSSRGRSILIDDVTGDGEPDVVAGTWLATIGGVDNAGAVYVWRGGAAIGGAPAPLATLTVPGASMHDDLGFVDGQGVELAEVTGDNVLDVVAGAKRADRPGVANAGAAYVWRGGAALAGPVAPTATLLARAALTDDELCSTTGLAIQVADVSGDGVLDLVIADQYADPGGVEDAGAIQVWLGGASLTGAPAPAASLVIPGASPFDGLSHGVVHSVFLRDVTGDGVPDVVGCAPYTTVGGIAQAGAVFLWTGPVLASPPTTFAVPGFPGDMLGGY